MNYFVPTWYFWITIKQIILPTKSYTGDSPYIGWYPIATAGR